MTIIKPQPGPQEMFLSTTADICIYGGAAGGGKTFGLLMEPLRHIDNGDFGAVIFRKTSNQITAEGGLWDTSYQLYPMVGGTPKKTPSYSWTFPSGMKVTFAHMQLEKDVLNWQGTQIPLICCEESTLIRMADGSMKALSEIKKGDMVETLQGPRPVSAIGNRRLEECVEVKNEYGQKQIQSYSHKVLTASSWVSYSEMCTWCGFRQPLTFLPIQYCDVDKFVEYYERRYPVWRPLPDTLFYRLRRVASLCQPKSQDVNQRVIFACMAQPGRESCFESYTESSPMHEQQPLIRRLREHQPQLALSKADNVFHAQFSGAERGVENASVNKDCSDRCSEDSYQYDGPVRWITNNDRGPVLQLNDVVVQTQKDLLLGDQDRAHKYIHHTLRYNHPYTGAAQMAEGVDISYHSCTFTPIGKRWVIDLTVSDVNHYITESGLINKNCFDELTHFKRSQFFYMLSRNRSGSGVPGYIRATCNPDASSWVAEFISWWWDPKTGYPIPERSGVIRWMYRRSDEIYWADNKEELWEQFDLKTPEERAEPKSVTFIASTLQDNKILLSKDPGYMANLKALPTVERERLLHGNWLIMPAAGLYFKRSRVTMLEEIPDDVVRWVRAWDLAATEDRRDTRPEDGPAYTAGVLLGKRRNGRILVADVINKRMNAADVRKTVKNTAVVDKVKYHHVRIRMNQEPGQAGKEQAEQYIKLLHGFSLHIERESGDKVTRFEPFSAQALGLEGDEEGFVDVLTAPWNEEYFNQLESFPQSRFKDMVDATGTAYNELERLPAMTPPPSDAGKADRTSPWIY